MHTNTGILNIKLLRIQIKIIIFDRKASYWDIFKLNIVMQKP